jgi:hypothetical protein
MSSSNPFEVLQSTEPASVTTHHYGSMGRWLFCFSFTGLLFMQLVAFVMLRMSMSLTTFLFFTVTHLVLLALQIRIFAARLKHLGYSRVWLWALLAPPMNLVLLLHCCTAPMGYHHHAKYDRRGSFCLIILLAALMLFGALVVLAA